MKIGIISDIHDHLENLNKALEKLKTCDEYICCGDLCSPFIVKALGEGIQKTCHIVFGNNDADKFRMMIVGSSYPLLKFYGEYVELNIDNRIIALNHFDNIGRALAKAPGFDLICFGHNHQKEITTSDSNHSIILNPGEVFGQLSGVASVATYDTQLHQAELIEI